MNRREFGRITWLAALGATALSKAGSKPDFSSVPGVVIAHSPAASGQYIGSPGIAALPNGDYLAKHDFFGPGSTEQTRALTRVYISGDKGKTWSYLSEVNGLFWASIFYHQGAVFMMGTDRNYGDAVITKSADGGKTWSKPKDQNNGLIYRGHYHTAPVPVAYHNGRIWRGMEDLSGPLPGLRLFRAFMMSAPVDADLLRAESWTASARIAGKLRWLGGRFGGWLEGNAAVTPTGEIVDVLRVEEQKSGRTAAVVKISADGKDAVFDPETGFIDFPGGAKKFTIRFDPVSALYWSLVNHSLKNYPGLGQGRVRNTQALVCSPDLYRWDIKKTVLHHPDVKKHGFQYLDWLFEGDDLLAVSRTAFDDGLGGAHSAHDANFLAFHRVKNFRAEAKGGT